MGLLGIFTLILVLGFSEIRRWHNSIFPDVTIVTTHYPQVLGKADNQLLIEFTKKRPRNWISIKRIPKAVVAAVILSEDASFFQHAGYSPEAIRGAIAYNARPTTKIKRGGSTISQQVVKNLFLTHEKKWTRKLREILITMELERTVSKAKILELYFNIVEWGPGTFGIAAASQRYFHKPAEALTAYEGASLAFMLPNPKRYRHSIESGELTSFAERRIGAILNRMYKTRKISEEEFSTALPSGTSSSD